MYKTIQCKSALNKVKGSFPYKWDLNIYRGCIHSCKYCYAIYSHKYIDSTNFFSDIHIKTNIIDELEKQLKSKSWKREIINIGGVTDSYQSIEKKYKFMPEILKLLIKYKTPAIISTKSKLILRDYDLIDELSNITYINIASTITTLDEKVSALLESGASRPLERFEILKIFRKTNASIGLHTMPIIPYLTDDLDNLEDLFYNAKKSDVHYILTGILYLRGETRKVFFNFILKNYPHLYKNIYMIYNNRDKKSIYKSELYTLVNSLRSKYSISSNYGKIMREKLKPNQEENLQLKLF